MLQAEEPATKPAQANGGSFLTESSEALGAIASMAGARGDAEKYVADKGWQLGSNDDDRYVVIGTADIAGIPSSSGFQAARQSAFVKALLNAKEQVAMFYAQKISTETLYGAEQSAKNPANFAQPANSTAPAPLSIFQKIKLLVHANLDEALKKKGVEPAKATKEQVKEVEAAVLTTELRQTIQRMAAAEVGALITQKIFEDGNAIAVVAYYSPRSKELSDALLGKGPAPKGKPQEQKLGQWINSFTPEELYASQGVQVRFDEKGEANLVAFGQYPVTINSSLGTQMAATAAETAALGALRNYAGEYVEAEIKQEMLERTKQYGDMGKGLAEAEQDMQMKETVRARAEALTVQGVAKIKQWTRSDTRSGRALTGVVVAWSLANARRAEADKQAFAASAGSKGGDGTSGGNAAASAKPKAAPAKESFDPTKKVDNKVQSKDADPF